MSTSLCFTVVEGSLGLVSGFYVKYNDENFAFCIKEGNAMIIKSALNECKVLPIKGLMENES